MSLSHHHSAAVYYALTEGIDRRALTDEWAAVLTTEEAARLSSLRLERDQRDYLAAHVLLRRALGAERGLGPRSLRPGERIGWSLSHTDGFVVCAVAAEPGQAIGVDTESVTAAERLQTMTDTFLTADELTALPSDPNDRAVRMVEIWTAKEAVLKARGAGFSGEEGFRVLSSLQSTPLGMLDGWGKISVRDARTSAAYSVWRRWVAIHAIAIVAIEGNEEEPRLMGVSLQ